MGTLGLLFIHEDAEGDSTISNDTAGLAIAFSVFFFVANFAYGFGPIVWVYVAEIFPLKYRARANGLCTMANWVGNFAIAQFTPLLITTVQFNTFYIFGFFCVLAAALSAWLPETRNVPLESVGALFNDKTGFRTTSNDGAENEVVA